MSLWANIGSYIGGLPWGDAKTNQLSTNTRFVQEALGEEHDVDLTIDGSAAGQANHSPIAGQGTYYNTVTKKIDVVNGANIVTGLIGGRVNFTASAVDVTLNLTLNERTRYYIDGTFVQQTWDAKTAGAFTAQLADVWQVRQDATGVYQIQLPLGLTTDDIVVVADTSETAQIGLFKVLPLDAITLEYRHYDPTLGPPPPLADTAVRVNIYLTKAI